ncbi:haloacid dehalogenase-like hydrolase domain-containing protein 2 [Drosophila albomicans]|uniref:Haloacid dehalogenase-like hydrolase domain-containing protein 2 n=1 Tax=Drosophila albomicans TaxID=7291 RepID=A0A6P8WL53_DROAB|nr:haloacid dehalogenase-like hydrolase domain-containing protein 2 [Drosophila albomicans]
MLCHRGICTQFRKMSIKAALIDLSGTLHVEDDPTPNAVAALQRLRESGISVKFVTNTTKDSKKSLHERLTKIGFQLDVNEIYSSLSAAAAFVSKEQLNPFYLLSDDARQDFPTEDKSRQLDSVVVGLAPNAFNYEHMNKAFSILLQQKSHKLVAVHQGKYYKRSDGLALGPGCFVKGLEYATGSTATVIGKPNPYFFKSALPEGLTAKQCVMIGDDANDDVAGAMAVGLQGILVKTGKFLPDALAALSTPPTAVVENFAEAVDWLLCKINS